MPLGNHILLVLSASHHPAPKLPIFKWDLKAINENEFCLNPSEFRPNILIWQIGFNDDDAIVEISAFDSIDKPLTMTVSLIFCVPALLSRRRNADEDARDTY